MKPIKQIITLFALIISISAVQAQDLINLFPKETTFMGMIDLGQINSKAKFEELIKLPMVEKLDKDLSKEFFKEFNNEDTTSILNLKKYGINTSSKGYFYIKYADNVYYGALVVALEDEIKFTNFAEMLTKTEEGKQTVNLENYKYTNKNKLKIVWNSKSAAFFGASISPDYKDSLEKSLIAEIRVLEDQAAVETYVNDYAVEDTTNNYEYKEPAYNDDEAVADSTYNYEEPYYEPYTDPYSEVYIKVSAACDSIVNEWCLANTGVFVKDKGANSLANNIEFVEYIKSNPDAALMIDYSQLIDKSMSLYTGLGYSSMAVNSPYEYLKGFYSGLKMFGKVEFSQDDVKMILDMKHSQKINEIYKEVTKTKISKNFLKYLDKDVMGYYAFGIDIEGLSKGLGNTLKQIYPAEPKYSKIIGSALDVVDIFIDEEAIYKVFTGDMVLAVNGVKPVEVIHTTYDYDENYNMTEVFDTTMQMQPEVLCMIGVGNVADVNKIFKLLTSFDALKQDGNLYSISVKYANLPIYFKIQDDILFISNNRKYVEQPQVYAKNKQLGKVHSKMFKENNFVAYANTSNIAQYFVKQNPSENDKILTDASQLFKSVKMLGRTKNGYSSASCVIELSKRTDNSIVDILKFLNDLYIAKGKKL